MSFRTGNAQFDGSINIDGSIFVYNAPFIGGGAGTQGIQGIQGRQGIQGIQGIQGRQGVQGITGSAPSADVYTTSSNYSIPTSYMGWIFEVSSASARTIYVPAGVNPGDQLAFINIGTGAGAPTIRGMGTKLKYQWSAASAYYNDGFNIWTLIGDVST